MLVAVLGFLSTAVLPAFAWDATLPSNTCSSTPCTTASYTFAGDCASWATACTSTTGSKVYDSLDIYDPGGNNGAYDGCTTTGGINTGYPDDACGITGTVTFALYSVSTGTTCPSDAPPSGTLLSGSSSSHTFTSPYSVPPVVATSPTGYTLTAVGHYIWYTTYTGNYMNGGTAYSCEYLTVTQGQVNGVPEFSMGLPALLALALPAMLLLRSRLPKA